MSIFVFTASLTTHYVTIDGYDMITQLQALRVHSDKNYDCPEYGMSGLLEGTKQNSSFIVHAQQKWGFLLTIVYVF